MTALVAFDCGAAFPFNNRTVAAIITEHLGECPECERLDHQLDHRNQEYSDLAVMADAKATDLNRYPDRDWPLEISGDALAIHKEKHS
ncbi:hypothetical protein [Brevibacterium zhoupengii]|uniref:hypothetical protein n=1 Tax=Brevibacterium zhoupengii TaxID=2898795 RepID=UPI001F08ECF8|nr:hypothetical protein [Brevibacterium zhoupengii]